MRALALALTVGVLAVGCHRATADQASDHTATGRGSDTLLLRTRCETVDAHRRCTLWGVSLVELIARPEVYDGKAVRVVGFANFEFEGNGLYLSREDWERAIYRNALWIDPPRSVQTDSGRAPTALNRRYVIVEGTFNATHRGHLGMFSGALERVTRLDPWGK